MAQLHHPSRGHADTGAVPRFLRTQQHGSLERRRLRPRRVLGQEPRPLDPHTGPGPSDGQVKPELQLPRQVGRPSGDLATCTLP